jgi:cobalt-zinc-cadmium efflux system protein
MTPSSDTDSVTVSFMVVSFFLSIRLMGGDPREAPDSSVAVGARRNARPVWQTSSGFPSLSAHVLVHPGDDCHGIRRELERLLDAPGCNHGAP